MVQRQHFLRFFPRFKSRVALLFAGTLAGAVWLFGQIPQEIVRGH
jgi:hypothetical protein